MALHPSSQSWPMDTNVPDLLSRYRFVCCASLESCGIGSSHSCVAVIVVPLGIQTAGPFVVACVLLPGVHRFPVWWLHPMSGIPL
eukprot:13898601-Ditylum_brightwellii.AAC.1